MDSALHISVLRNSNFDAMWCSFLFLVASKDLTYAICVDPPKKRVLVVFRGAITRQDWSRAFESRNFRQVSNPIDEDYKDKANTINVSSGFYQYLFRRRKDTGTCKYDEISSIACKYGTEMIGEDFTLFCTGHSLGGALSTMFSFFASADDRFTRNGPVKVFNFGSPYVGGREFQIAFQHQEKRKKIQYARFFNHNDIGEYIYAAVSVSSCSLSSSCANASLFLFVLCRLSVAHLHPNFGITKVSTYDRLLSLFQQLIMCYAHSYTFCFSSMVPSFVMWALA